MSQTQDEEEKFDPAAAIWEKQIKKKQEADAKKHAEKDAQLDQVRKQVKVQDTKSAMDTWKEAEASLNQVLKGKRQEAAGPPDPGADAGLRKHGQHVKGRKEYQNPNQASQASPPLQRSSWKTDDRDPGATARSVMTGGSDEWDSPRMTAGSSFWGQSSCGSAHSTFRSTARSNCFDKKAELLRQKSSNTSERLADHARRRLKAKIATVLIEVRKRQDLHQLQEKAKKFRENRFARGAGINPKNFGDTTEHAFGVTCLSHSSNEEAMTSPRRTALLDSLTLEELALIRERPVAFFTGNAIAPAMRPEQMGGDLDRTRSMGATTGSFSSTSSPAPRGLWQGAADADAFEDLIEFFSVSSADKVIDVKVYAYNLRVQLLASAGRHNAMNGQGAASEDVDWRKRLCRYRDPDESVQEEETVLDENMSQAPLEMMPCLGRHPPIRSDQQSPTLEKVREVYQRRDEQDKKWIDERHEMINRRTAMNAFKAREQQRELLLQDFKQKELHKVRMLQAEEKKAMLEAEALERTEVMSIQKIHRLISANERAESYKLDKRDQAQVSLEAWHAGCERAHDRNRKLEWEKYREGERNYQKYMQRLTALGESRMVDSKNKSQEQLNGELKARIQDSLVFQIKEDDQRKSEERAEALRTKLENAAIRRSMHQSGNRYHLVEKAFGANSVGFDAKHHTVSVDRRSKSWQKSAEAWNKMKGSFSAPVLPPTSPLSPGGTLDEAAFKSMRKTHSGFKMSNTAFHVTMA